MVVSERDLQTNVVEPDVSGELVKQPYILGSNEELGYSGWIHVLGRSMGDELPIVNEDIYAGGVHSYKRGSLTQATEQLGKLGHPNPSLLAAPFEDEIFNQIHSLFIIHTEGKKLIIIYMLGVQICRKTSK